MQACLVGQFFLRPAAFFAQADEIFGEAALNLHGQQRPAVRSMGLQTMSLILLDWRRHSSVQVVHGWDPQRPKA